MRKVWSRVSLALAVCFVVNACGSNERATPPAAEPAAAATVVAPPALEPLPEVTVDSRKVLLGRRLFHDVRLSGDQTLSCATCHSLDHGGAEPRRTSIGIRSQVGPINSPTVLNAGLNFVQFWDGRAATLEEQAAGPVANSVEMGASWESVMQTLLADDTLRAEVAAIYPEGINQTSVTDALAEYERSLTTPGRFDAFLRGDRSALSDDERRGYELFTTIGCTSCHRGPNVGGTMYQKMGLVRDYFAARGTPITDADLGRYNVTRQESDKHRFKVPTLRNVALTSPYLHDGTQDTLEDVVKVMGRFQLGRELDEDQVRLLVAFLRSLTGELPAHARLPESAQPAIPSPTAPPVDVPSAH